MMNRILKTTLLIAAVLLLVTGCSSRDDRLTRMAEQQAAQNREMVKLNREVAKGMTRLTKENALFRQEALRVQKQLHAQRGELIKKQEALDEERRRFAQHDPLVSKAVTHVGITLACLFPLGLCWYLLQQPMDRQIDCDLNELLLRDLTSERPVLVSQVMDDSPPHLEFQSGVSHDHTDRPAQKLTGPQ